KLDLHYHLLQAQTEMLFASYHLELSWD
ncbi:TPA: DUF1934 domain-containing protein, partial [Streptococcus pyogenes]